MIRNVFLLGALLFVILLGFWIQTLRNQNEKLKLKIQKVEDLYKQSADRYKLLYETYERLENQSHQSAPPVEPSLDQLQSQLRAEQQKLDALKKEQADEKASNGRAADSHDIDEHIASDEIDIRELQVRLERLNDDNRSVEQKSKDYLDSQAYQRETQKATLLNQMQAIDQSIEGVKGQVSVLPRGRANPNWQNDLAQLNAQLADLRSQKGTVAASLRQLDLDAKATSNQVASEVRAEKMEVASDRDRQRKQLDDLKDDLNQWKKVKADQSKPPLKIATLQKDIAIESAKIADLEKAIKAMTDKH